MKLKFAQTKTLRIAYLEDGDAGDWPVILSHGFPYDVHALDEVVPLLVCAGAHEPANDSNVGRAVRETAKLC